MRFLGFLMMNFGRNMYRILNRKDKLYIIVRELREIGLRNKQIALILYGKKDRKYNNRVYSLWRFAKKKEEREKTKYVFPNEMRPEINVNERINTASIGTMNIVQLKKMTTDKDEIIRIELEQLLYYIYQNIKPQGYDPDNIIWNTIKAINRKKYKVLGLEKRVSSLRTRKTKVVAYLYLVLYCALVYRDPFLIAKVYQFLIQENNRLTRKTIMKELEELTPKFIEFFTPYIIE